MPNGVTVGALAAVNATGSVTVGASRHFWAAPFEIGDEFGGLGYPSPMPADAQKVRLKFRDKPRAGENTTIAVDRHRRGADQGRRQAAGDRRA